MEIEFTQFLLPDGRKRPLIWDTDLFKELEDSNLEEAISKAIDLEDAGANFEIEILTTGQLSMDCTLEDGDIPLGMELCEQEGVQGIQAVYDLILSSWETLQELPDAY